MTLYIKSSKLFFKSQCSFRLASSRLSTRALKHLSAVVHRSVVVTSRTNPVIVRHSATATGLSGEVSRSCFSGQSFLLPQLGCSNGKFTGLQPAPATAAALQPWQRTSWLPVIEDPCRRWKPYSCIYRCIHTKGCLCDTSHLFFKFYIVFFRSNNLWCLVNQNKHVCKLDPLELELYFNKHIS